MKWPVLRRNERLDAVRDNFNNGYLRFYDGTRPADGDTPLAGNNLLAELRFAATAFPAASGGVLTANALVPDSLANANGTASFARAFESDGTTPAGDLSVGLAGSGPGGSDPDIVMPTTTIVQNAQISISSLTITDPPGS